MPAFEPAHDDDLTGGGFRSEARARLTSSRSQIFRQSIAAPWRRNKQCLNGRQHQPEFLALHRRKDVATLVD
jgi:hypothetical protein